MTITRRQLFATLAMTHEDEYRQMHLRASEPQPRTTYIVGPPAALAAYTRLIAGDSRYLVVDGLDTVSRGAILDGLRENPITEMLNAPNPMAQIARDMQAREEAALHSQARAAADNATTHVTAYRGIDRAQFIDPIHPIPGIPAGRELTEAEATKALEAVMQERIKEALDRDIDTHARYEGSVLGNPVVSDPSMPPGVVGAVRLTIEQLEATKHLKPGEAWAKAGQSLEPEPPAKVEDLDEF